MENASIKYYEEWNRFEVYSTYTQPVDTLIDVSLTSEMQRMLTEYMYEDLSNEKLQCAWQQILDKDRNNVNIFKYYYI